MRTSARVRAAAWLACIIVLIASAAASARTGLSIEPADGIEAISNGAVSFRGGEVTIACTLALNGELNPGISKLSARSLSEGVVGYITEGVGSGCTEAFGSITYALLAEEEAPVSLRYDAFLGTLPSITGTLLMALQVPSSFTSTFLGTCLYQGDVGLLVTFPAGETGNRVSVLGNRVSRRTGGGLCPATVELAGTFTLSPPQRVTLLETAPARPVRVVSVGDSFISGEAGRWAGNTARAREERIHDALERRGYYDNPRATAELIALCHRSRSAEIYIAPDAIGRNFACSGATVRSQFAGAANTPGLDFERSGTKIGQGRMLRAFARRHRREIKMVVVSIGGNDFGFATVVKECVRSYLFLRPRRCSLNVDIRRRFEAAVARANTATMATGLVNVHSAMEEAGYRDEEYKILVQNYMSLIPTARQFRYEEREGEGETEPEGEREGEWEEEGPREFEPEEEEENFRAKIRHNTGGCGFWNIDARWATETALPTINTAVRNAITESRVRNILALRLDTAFELRRLCERRNVGLLEEKRLRDWRAARASDETEWINHIRIRTIFGQYYQQESIHPNYWGQLALRNCVRRAFNRGTPREGTCTINGVGLEGTEPRMELR
jgi:hypothetical protein